MKHGNQHYGRIGRIQEICNGERLPVLVEFEDMRDEDDPDSWWSLAPGAVRVVASPPVGKTRSDRALSCAALPMADRANTLLNPALKVLVSVVAIVAVYVLAAAVGHASPHRPPDGAGTEPSSLEVMQYRATILGAVAAFLISLTGVGVTIVLYIRTRDLATKVGQAERLSDFSARFQSLTEMRYERKHQENPAMYYELFWLLQYDQYQAWHQKLVPNETFKYWLTTRSIAWQKDPEVRPKFGQRPANRFSSDLNESTTPEAPIKYREGFNSVIENWADDEFKKFFKALHAKGVLRAMKSEPQGSRSFGPR